MVYCLRSFILFTLFLCCSNSFSQSFEKITTPFTPAYGGKIKWVDLDNDHDLDLVHQGFTSGSIEYLLSVYENNNGSFINRNSGLPNVRNANFSFGDYDQDGDLDVLLSGLSGSNYISELYQNDGGFSFSLRFSFPGVLNSTTAWLDLENDGDLDFLITGIDDRVQLLSKTMVYENTGTAFQLLPDTNLPPCTQCGIAVSDANGDGLVDVLLTGFYVDDYLGLYSDLTGLYLNQGDHSFIKDENSSMPLVNNGDVKWGDIDNDGDPDALIGGLKSDGKPLPIYTRIYENRSGSLHERSDIILANVGESWFDATNLVDMDNDGLLDIVVSGRNNSIIELDFVFIIYKNNGDGSFTEVANTNLEGLTESSIDFGDYDNDGDIDICYQGKSLQAPWIVIGIYKNQLTDNTFSQNQKPFAPDEALFEEDFFRNQVTLKWKAGSDVETPTEGLSYNFYLRDDDHEIVYPNANLSSGLILTDNPANGHGKRAWINNLLEGQTYYWAVQSVDGAKEGSSFSDEKNFFQFNGPASVEAKFLDTLNVRLTWIDNSEIETGYKVQRSNQPHTGFVTIATLDENTTSYVDHNAFHSEMLYYYRIYAYNDSHLSGYDSLQIVLPFYPAGLTADAINASSIHLSWQDRSDYETGHVIVRKKTVDEIFEEVGTVESGIYTFTDTGLTEGTSYDYSVMASNQYGLSQRSFPASAQTNFRPLNITFNKELNEDEALFFKSLDFSSHFSDPDPGDSFVALQIKTLPVKGKLILNDVPVTKNQIIPALQTGGLKFVPDTNSNGSDQLDFYFNDGTDNSLSESNLTITITPVNDSPNFTIPATLERQEDFSILTKVSPTISMIPSDEFSQVVTYSILPLQSDKVQVNLNSKTGEITFTPILNQFGEVTFTLTADDGQSENNTATASIKLIIQPINDAPVISVIADQKVELNEEIKPVLFTVEDVDNPIESLKLTGTSSNQLIIENTGIEFLVQNMQSQIRLSPLKKTFGETVVTVSVSDGKLSSSTNFKFTTYSITGLSENMEENILFFPNPVTSHLTIITKDNSSLPKTLTITDVLGRVINVQTISTGESSIDLSGVGSGIYLLKISGDSRTIKIYKK